MNNEEALHVANQAIFAHRGKYLSDLHYKILQKSLENMTYEDMTDKETTDDALKYNAQHIKNVGSALWKILSKALGEKVTKINFRSALERRWQSHGSMWNAKSTTKLISLIGNEVQTARENTCESNQKQQDQKASGKPAKLRITLDAELTEDLKIRINDIEIKEFPDFLRALQEIVGDSNLNMLQIDKGSIIITLEGFPESLKLLADLFESGELTEVLGIPVEDIQILSESSDDKRHLVEEIISQAIEGRNLSGADLSGADLSGADLSGADLSGANLSGAILRYAILRGAILRYDILRGAILRAADLRGADLSGTDLSGADLSSADLSSANLSSANLSGADLCYAYLRGAILRYPDLSGANLSGANLSGADLRGANLSHVRLCNADLSGVDLSGTNLHEAVNVEGAQLGSGLGLTNSDKELLKSRGAIFDDFSGDREPVASPVNR